MPWWGSTRELDCLISIKNQISSISFSKVSIIHSCYQNIRIKKYLLIYTCISFFKACACINIFKRKCRLYNVYVNLYRNFYLLLALVWSDFLGICAVFPHKDLNYIWFFVILRAESRFFLKKNYLLQWMIYYSSLNSTQKGINANTYSQ